MHDAILRISLHNFACDINSMVNDQGKLAMELDGGEVLFWWGKLFF